VVLLLGVSLLLPACQSSQGGGAANPNGILWNSQNTGGSSGGSGGSGPTLWVDPNSGLGATPIGISSIITSTDDATYANYSPPGTGGTINTTRITYIFGLEHPLSTETGSQAIVSRESTLEGLINGYRQQQLGNVGIDPGVIGVFPQGVILAGHFGAQKCARAHGKHAAYFHTGPLSTGPNAEGDDLLMTVPGSQADTFGSPPPGNPNGKLGRLGKIGVVAAQGNQLCYSGTRYPEAQDVFNRILIDAPAMVLADWTHQAVGHWRGGTESFYWNIIFLTNPDPTY
jgi:hypothetical protein